MCRITTARITRRQNLLWEILVHMLLTQDRSSIFNPKISLALIQSQMAQQSTATCISACRWRHQRVSRKLQKGREGYLGLNTSDYIRWPKPVPFTLNSCRTGGINCAFSEPIFRSQNETEKVWLQWSDEFCSSEKRDVFSRVRGKKGYRSRGAQKRWANARVGFSTFRRIKATLCQGA